jgi:glycolate oxidase FAD binding subunit
LLIAGRIVDYRLKTGVRRLSMSIDERGLRLSAPSRMPLAEIEAALAAQGQCLPFEPPRFSPDSTIGGVVAAGLSGPRRASAGALRDYVLGVEILDGEARELTFGGQVMKNVAGYDVSRLIAGSLGTLGLITEVTLKVLPQPVAEATLRFEMTQGDALDQLNRWAGQPLPIVASAWQDGVLTLRFAGARAAVESATQKLGAGETAPAGYFAAVRDQRLPFFSTETLWRLSVPSTATPLNLPGEQLIEWGGALRWLKSDALPETIRTAAANAGGSAMLYRAPADLKQRVGAFSPLSAPLLKLHQNLKAAFDPHGLFNPGRMYSEF